MFVCDWEGVESDMLILGKVFGGGVFFIFCVVVNEDILNVFNFGFYGLIFGGNLFVCVVLLVVLEVIEDEEFLVCLLELGFYFKQKF